MNINTNTNKIGDRLSSLVTIAAVLLWLGVFVYSRTLTIPRQQYSVLFLGVIITIYCADRLSKSFQSDERNKIDETLLAVSILLAIIPTVYFYLNFEVMYFEQRGYTLPEQLPIAAAILIVVIWLSWREYGRAFGLVVTGAIVYGFIGNYIPGILGHPGFDVDRTLQILVINFNGIYGFLTRLVATWIALFLLLAGLLQGYGAFDLITRVAVKFSNYLRSGIAQSAVFASMAIGSINGSQTANAAMTGSFTIPIMKENGLSPETAAGVESTASTSGQVLPPVMGTAAFIMASLLGIRYIDVIIAGIVPAIIMAIAIAVAIHYATSHQFDIADTDVDQYFEETLSRWEIAYEGLRFGFPILILIYLLGILQWTVMTSAFWACIGVIFTGFTGPVGREIFFNETGSTVQQIKLGFFETIDGFKIGAVLLAPIAIIIAAINAVVQILVTTGVPSAVSLAILDLSGGILLVAALLAMFISILMGLGMPTAAAYLIVALLVAPALTRNFMIPEIAAHYFVFYAAILAGITPPIATCCAVACGVAQADFWGTCYESIKMSAPLFILPFSFMYHPYIIGTEFGFLKLAIGFVILLGALSIIYGINYHSDLSDIYIDYGIRGIYVVLGIVIMVHPTHYVQIGAVAVAAAVHSINTQFSEILLRKLTKRNIS